MKAIAASLLAALASLSMVQAATNTWTGASSSDWFDPANWTPASVPGPEDTAWISSGTAVVSADATVAGLMLAGGALGGGGC